MIRHGHKHFVDEPLEVAMQRRDKAANDNHDENALEKPEPAPSFLTARELQALKPTKQEPEAIDKEPPRAKRGTPEDRAKK